MILLRAALVLTLCTTGASALDMGGRIRAAIENSRAGRAFWGVQVADLESGRTLFTLNPDRLFTPASNTKLFSTALALVRLGPEHRFRTRVLSAAPPVSGVLDQDLILLGGGDPNLSARAIPYRKGPVEGDPLRAIAELARQVYAAGVREIRGGVVGDDTWYLWEPYAEGWAADDGLWEYGAAVSALTVNDNTLILKVAPGDRVDEPASVRFDPSVEFYHIDNRVRTIAGGESKLFLDRLPGSRLLRIWGSIGLKERPRSRWLGVHDPALFAAVALRDALIRTGVPVRGPATARHLYPNEVESLERLADAPAPAGVELAGLESPPMVEDLRITNKVSQNLHAELALRAVARARRNIGSRQAGLLELAEFLAEAGIEKGEYDFNDGSGLSRMNLVSPAAVVRLLRYLYDSPSRDIWLSLLPVAGEDGTLDSRFKATAATQRIQAKTGTLAHVHALSGYARTRTGKMLAFAILVNNAVVPGSEVRAAIDKIGDLITE